MMVQPTGEIALYQHLRNIFEEGELNSLATSKDFLQVQQEGSRNVHQQVTHYNLDAIHMILKDFE